MMNQPDFRVSPIVLWLTRLPFQLFWGILSAILIFLFVISAYLFNPLVGIELNVTDFPARISYVAAGSPAQNAGLLEGDRVLKIDGEPVLPWGNQPIYRAGIQPGETITFEVLRSEQTLEIPVITGRLFSRSLEVVLNIGLILLPTGFWLIGMLMVLFAAEGALPARLLGFHWMLTGLSLSAALFGRAGYFWGANTIFLVCWALLIFTNIVVHLHFPTVVLSDKWQRRVTALLAMLAFGLATLAIVADWVLFPQAWREGVQAYENFVPFGTAISSLILIGYFISFLLGIVLLIRSHFRFRRTHPGLSQQTRLVIAGMLLAIMPVLLFSFLPYLLSGIPWLTPSLGFLFFLVIPLSYAYAIFQRKLIQVDLFINRAVVLFILAVTILAAASLLFLLITRLFNLPESAQPVLAGTIALLVSLPTASLRDRFQVLVNYLMYGAHYDYTSITSEFSSQLARTVERAKLIELLTQTLPKRMGIRESALFLVENGHITRQGPGEALSIPLDSPFCLALHDLATPARPQQFENILPENLAWGQLFGPLISEHHFYGLLVLGARIKGDLYHGHDLKIITTVTQQSALAYANVYLLERPRAFARRVVQNDEAQRKKWAWGLHDAVLQNLFFVRYRLLEDPQQRELAQLLDDSILHLRETIQAQHPSYLDQSLDLALQDLILDLRKKIGAKPGVSWYSNLTKPLQMEEEKKIALYRIVQEAITNAWKHAQAQTIRVKLEKTASGEIMLLIEDDGIGMPPENPTTPGHLGLEGMRERALMIGAALHISSHPGAGTTVILRFTE